jgi:hypothetical protein
MKAKANSSLEVHRRVGVQFCFSSVAEPMILGFESS